MPLVRPVDGRPDGGNALNIAAWALLPIALTLIAAVAAVLIVTVVMKGTASRDRATVLNAVAEVIHAVRSSRR